MRCILLPLLIFVTMSASAQVTRKFMGELVNQYNKCISYLQGIEGAPSNKDTAFMVQQTDLFNAMANSVYEDADLNQKKALLYYSTILEFRMGYMYVEGEYWADSYERFYKPAETGMKFITQPGWFPVVYETDSLEYTLDRNYITKIEFIFYTDLLHAALESGNWQGAKEAYSTILRTYKMPVYTKFIASGAMIKHVTSKKTIEAMSFDEKDELVKYYAENIASLGQFDEAAMQKLNKSNKVDYATLYNGQYNDVMKLLPQTNPKWRTHNYEDIGIAYYDAKDTAKARDFFMAALNTNERMESLTLNIAADIAMKKMDKEMGLKVIENLKEYHSWDPYELESIGSLYRTIFDDKKSANKYFREANKARKHK